MTKEEKEIIHKWLLEAIANGGVIPFDKFTMPDIYINRFNFIDLGTIISYKDDLDLIKPIARPLSSLTKPIKVEGYNEGKSLCLLLDC